MKLKTVGRHCDFLEKTKKVVISKLVEFTGLNIWIKFNSSIKTYKAIRFQNKNWNRIINVVFLVRKKNAHLL